MGQTNTPRQGESPTDIPYVLDALQTADALLEGVNDPVWIALLSDAQSRFREALIKTSVPSN